MERFKNKKCIVRSYGAGVFFGTVADILPNNVAVIENCRRIYYWSGAASLSQMATEGVKRPDECKFTVTVPQMMVTGILEIIPCSEDAVRNIENVPVWKQR